MGQSSILPRLPAFFPSSLLLFFTFFLLFEFFYRKTRAFCMQYLLEMNFLGSPPCSGQNLEKASQRSLLKSDKALAESAFSSLLLLLIPSSQGVQFCGSALLWNKLVCMSWFNISMFISSFIHSSNKEPLPEGSTCSLLSSCRVGLYHMPSLDQLFTNTQ